MTYREWITLTCKGLGASNDTIELVIINQLDAIGGDADAEVNVKTAKTALVHEFATVLPLANISEGGYSLSWNYDLLKWWYKLTCAELGIDADEATTPKLRYRNII